MSQVVLELPESLHVEVERQAEREGISLQDYLIDVLTCFAAQRRDFEEMTTRYPREDAEAAFRGLTAMRIPFEESED
ncbi:MAG TPA: hypothetical protein VLX28_01925 [Thermoanaerobaculia bacterium]|nr:hypothetical protein [Thermoanaerobaculia bacterium]